MSPTSKTLSHTPQKRLDPALPGAMAPEAGAAGLSQEVHNSLTRPHEPRPTGPAPKSPAPAALGSTLQRLGPAPRSRSSALRGRTLPLPEPRPRPGDGGDR